MVVSALPTHLQHIKTSHVNDFIFHVENTRSWPYYCIPNLLDGHWQLFIVQFYVWHTNCSRFGPLFHWNSLTVPWRRFWLAVAVTYSLLLAPGAHLVEIDVFSCCKTWSSYLAHLSFCSHFLSKLVENERAVQRLVKRMEYVALR